MSKVMQIPQDAPVEAAAADSALSAAESRPAVQGEAQDERPKKDWVETNMNPFYRKKCNQMFSQMDSDDDEILEEEEVIAYFDVAEKGYSTKELSQKLFAEADADHNGQVSRKEWHVFAEAAEAVSKTKTERWNPMEHLKSGVKGMAASEMEKNIEELNSHYRRLARRIFTGMDKDGDDVATKGELAVYFDKKFHERDPHQFARIILSKADKDGDGKLTSTEFLEWAGEARETSKDQHERWNPLLIVAKDIRRNQKAPVEPAAAVADSAPAVAEG